MSDKYYIKINFNELTPKKILIILKWLLAADKVVFDGQKYLTKESKFKPDTLTYSITVIKETIKNSESPEIKINITKEMINFHKALFNLQNMVFSMPVRPYSTESIIEESYEKLINMLSTNIDLFQNKLADLNKINIMNNNLIKHSGFSFFITPRFHIILNPNEIKEFTKENSDTDFNLENCQYQICFEWIELGFNYIILYPVSKSIGELLYRSKYFPKIIEPLCKELDAKAYICHETTSSNEFSKEIV